MNLFIDSIEHRGGEALDDAEHARRMTHAYTAGREFTIEAGKRAEFKVEPGEHAVVYLLEGAVRFEGDDTPAGEGDTVRFKPAPDGEIALLGIQADRPARGILVAGAHKGLRPAI
jgi:redox-sensitive bicupin YhaK (pirin superfamily)